MTGGSKDFFICRSCFERKHPREMKIFEGTPYCHNCFADHILPFYPNYLEDESISPKFHMGPDGYAIEDEEE